MKKIVFYTEENFTFRLKDKNKIRHWLEECASQENKQIHQITYIFCSDEYLLELNRTHLNHNTYTDIITFDYTEENNLIGEIYISVERIKENAKKYKVSFKEELLRVMIHGLLHLSGYKDKTKQEKKQMREKETEKLGLFHVKQKGV
jgi:rRNA maturation RNase YbeY